MDVGRHALAVSDNDDPGQRGGVVEHVLAPEQEPSTGPGGAGGGGDGCESKDDVWSTPSPGATSMMSAILAGDAAPVENMLSLERSEDQQLKLLTTTYGGRGDGGTQDGNGLYGETSPIFHAALTGNKEVFFEIADAMTRFGHQMWSSYSLQKDHQGRTLLAEAARAGNWYIFYSALTLFGVGLLKSPPPEEQADAREERAIRIIIQRGNGAALRSYLDGTSQAEKRGVLTTTYGGRGDSRFPDKNGLFGDSLPVLHAALAGQVDAFWVIVEAMKKNFEPNQLQLKMAMMKEDRGGRSCLLAAARSGNQRSLEAVVDVLKGDHLIKANLIILRAYEWSKWAEKKCGSPSVLVDLLRSAKTGYTDDLYARFEHHIAQQNEEVMSRMMGLQFAADGTIIGIRNKSRRLPFALSPTALQDSGDEDEEDLETVLTELLGQSGTKESHSALKDLASSLKDMGGRAILTEALKEGRKEATQGALNVLRSTLKDDEVEKIICLKDAQHRTALAEAAEYGTEGAFETVVKELHEIKSQEVRRMLTAQGRHGESLLAAAAGSGNEKTFIAVFDVLRENLVGDEMKRVLGLKDERLQSILATAAGSLDWWTFKAVVAASRNELGSTEVKAMLEDDGGGRKTILQTVMGNTKMLRNVLSVLHEELGEEKTSEIIKTSRFKFAELAAAGEGSNVFKNFRAALFKKIDDEKIQAAGIAKVLANSVGSGSMDKLRSAKVTLSQLDITEAKQALLEAGRGGALLTAAATTGNKELFEDAVSILKDKLQPREVNRMIKDAKSILRDAAGSGSTDTFNAVVVELEKLGSDEVKRKLQWRHFDVIRTAVMSNSKGIFLAVLRAEDKHCRIREGHQLQSQPWYARGLSVFMPSAATSSNDMFSTVLAFLSWELGGEDEMKKLLRAPNEMGDTSLSAAAASGSKKAFEAVLTCLFEKLEEKEVMAMVLAPGRSATVGAWPGILEAALRDGGEIMFEAVLAVLHQRLTKEEVRGLVTASSSHGDWVHRVFSLKSRALQESVLKCAWGPLEKEKVASEMTDAFDQSASAIIREGFGAANRGNIRASGSHKDAYEEDVQWDQAEAAWAPEAFSGLLKYGSQPRFQHLRELTCPAQYEGLKRCCLDAVASADNPFVPGLALSVALADAVEKLPEGDQWALKNLQESVDALLLEILERLPQTVIGFEEAMDGCSAVFELESTAHCRTTVEGIAVPDPRGLNGDLPGPLMLAFQRQAQTKLFCTRPLVVDFLSRTFTRGLPNWWDSDATLLDDEELAFLHGQFRSTDNRQSVEHFLSRCEQLERLLRQDQGREGSLVHDERLLPMNAIFRLVMSVYQCRYICFCAVFPLGALVAFALLLETVCVTLQGLGASETILPGVQFVAVGLVAKPSTYYMVPVMRMVLDFVVYLGVLVFFSCEVLLHEDGPLTWGEYAFAVYIAAGFCEEVRDFRKDAERYLNSYWNILDVLGLVLSMSGFICRTIDSQEAWGRALYAMSAPLLFSRILFFAQVLHFQGPMIQVISAMMADFFRFAVIMAVVMGGFAMSFYSLSRDGDTWLYVFNAMLGNEFFDDFEDAEYQVVGTILLVVYLIIITILLLNLLVAILSTSHSNMHGNAEVEYNVSKARFVQHYRSVVREDLLPPPFNLLRFPGWLCDYLSKSVVHVYMFLRNKEDNQHQPKKGNGYVGRLVFWALLSPLAFSVGSVLWLASTPLATYRAFRSGSSKKTEEEVQDSRAERLSAKMSAGMRRARKTVGVFLLCVVGAPICLFALWMKVSLVCLWGWMRATFGWLIVCCVGAVQASCGAEQKESAVTSRRLPRRRCVRLNVNNMLKKSPGGLLARDLGRYVEDPMSDPSVRKDETTRPSTVEHLKLLRDRLEEKHREQFLSSREELAATVAHMEKRLGDKSSGIDKRLGAVEKTLRLTLNAVKALPRADGGALSAEQPSPRGDAAPNLSEQELSNE